MKKIKGLFKKNKKEDENFLSTDVSKTTLLSSQKDTTDEEDGKNMIDKGTEAASDAFSKAVGDDIKGMFDYGKGYKWFMALFIIGCPMIFISLFFIPFIFVAPRKTASFLNLGTICILFSFAMQKGWKEFFIDEFFNAPKPRIYFAYGFLFSFVMCTWFAIFKNKFWGSLIFLIAEIVLCIYFIAIHYPNGVEGVNHFFKTLWEGIKKCFKKTPKPEVLENATN